MMRFERLKAIGVYFVFDAGSAEAVFVLEKTVARLAAPIIVSDEPSKAAFLREVFTGFLLFFSIRAVTISSLLTD